MKTKVCPECLLDQLGCWLADTDWELSKQGTDYDGLLWLSMAWQGTFTINRALYAIPSSYLCAVHQKERTQQKELFGEEVVLNESAH